MIHWLNIHLWAPIWPNALAPSAWTLFGLALSHFRMKKHVNAKHDELKAHVDAKHKELKEHLSK
jgi:hypothetical protein